MSKNQFTGTATPPQRNRKLCQFNKDEYCTCNEYIPRISRIYTFRPSTSVGISTIFGRSLLILCRQFCISSGLASRLSPFLSDDKTKKQITVCCLIQFEDPFYGVQEVHAMSILSDSYRSLNSLKGVTERMHLIDAYQSRNRTNFLERILLGQFAQNII